MGMRAYRAGLIPLTAFGTKPKGDTLFGQLCWAIRNRYGEDRLAALLRGYTEGEPSVVISDAFPAGFLPRPSLPGHYFEGAPEIDRKAAKKRAWLPLDQFQTPVASWLKYSLPSNEIPSGTVEEHPQPHNTLNRNTGTTGEDQFAPYVMNQFWYGEMKMGDKPTAESLPPIKLEIYMVLDESRLSPDELSQILSDIGLTGFGRDASIGLGKFSVGEMTAIDLPAQNFANAWLTLAPCAPQGLPWLEDRCFYQPFTRFGRHGDIGVHMPGGPFKTPVLLADTGAVLTPAAYQDALFTGLGRGGNDSLSKTIRGTVHQGYAPVAAIALPRANQRRSP